MKSFLNPTKKKIIETLFVSIILWGIGGIHNYFSPPLLGAGYHIGESDNERFQRILSESFASFIILSVTFFVFYVLVAYVGTKNKKSYVIVPIVVCILLFITYVMPFIATLILNYYNFSAFPNR